MPWFLTFIIWVAIAVVSELLRPKPKFEDARPAGEGDFSFPTATEGRAVPIVWGRVRLRAPNIVWYGNIGNIPITEKVKTGLFSSDDVVVGHKYLVSMQFALCLGQVDKLERVWIEETIAGGAVGSGSGAVNVFRSLGGDDVGGNGFVASDPSIFNPFGGILGIPDYGRGYGYFYDGGTSQTADPWLDNFIPVADLPGYRGVSYYVFDGTIGNSPSLSAWAFEVSRRPDPLNMATADPGAEAVNTWDCNPMNALYEIMTDVDWGLGISPSKIDVPNFQAAASTLATEGQGFSLVVDRELEATELITEIQRQIDGALYFDRAAGEWKMKLIRDDYTPGDLTVYDESNILKLGEYSRASWAETTNQVRVQFEDFSDDWKTTYAVAQDIANFEIQGANVSADVRYPGVKNKTLANILAWRELRTLSFPLAKITHTVNREGFNLVPGSVFKFSWTRLGISELIFRVSRINFGNITDGSVEIQAVEDIFATGSAAFGDPTGTGWGDPLLPPTAVVAADTLTFEAPRQLVVADVFNPSLQPRVWAGARIPAAGTTGFRMYSRFDTARPLTGDPFVVDATITRFLIRASLNANLTDYGSSATRPATDYNIELVDADPDDLANYEFSAGPSVVSDLAAIVYINGEFIGYEELEDQGGGVFYLKRIYRGLFNTAPKAHSSGDDVWFIAQGGGNLTNRSLGTADDEIDVQLRSFSSLGDEIDEATTPIEELTLVRLWRDPLPPRDPTLNDNYAPSSEDVDTQYTTETGLTGDDARAIKVEFAPRAWRIDDVLLDPAIASSSPAYLDDAPEFDVLLILDPSGTPTNLPVQTVTGSDAEAPELYILRNTMIEALGVDTNIPSTGQIQVTSKHTPVEGSTEYTAQETMDFDFTVTSSLQGSGIVHGAEVVSTIFTGVTYNESGTYAFDIHTALPASGILEGRINGGSFVTIIAAGMTTGNLTGVTGGDTIELRFTQAPANDQFFDVTGPTSETGYGVLLA